MSEEDQLRSRAPSPVELSPPSSLAGPPLESRCRLVSPTTDSSRSDSEPADSLDPKLMDTLKRKAGRCPGGNKNSAQVYSSLAEQQDESVL
jgi:hypothetical protein